MECILSENMLLISRLNKIENSYPVTIIQYKKICIIPSSCLKYIDLVLKTLFSELNSDFLIWTAIDLQDSFFLQTVENCVQKGFNSPHISEITPLKKPINISLVLCRQNIPADPSISENTLKKVLYALQQYKLNSETCSLYAKFSKNAIYFLRECTKKGFTTNKNGEKTQKELSGELVVKKIVKNSDKLLYIIDVNRDSVKSGEEEAVSVSATRYNFHSHPEEAYIRHSVDNAWPSLTDYVGYFKLGNNTIFHSVASLEGVYILSFSPYWVKRLNELNEKIIKKKYNIESEDEYTPSQYVKKVNEILYKNHPIFNLKYFPWKKADTPFEISFSKTGISCLSSQQIMQKYKKLY